MSRLNRRDFLKALGFTGSASVLSACGIDDNRFLTPIENVLPYVVRPEQVTPGTPTFFATSITRGFRAWPLLARHREGRVVNVGANRRTPVAAAIPAAAFFELQRQYSPDRHTGPLAKGGAGFEPLAWDQALARLAESARVARAGGKKVAYLGPYQSGAIVKLVQDYTGGEAVFWEPLGPEAEVRAAEILFGQRVLPAYDLTNARYVLSFGAEFLSTWGPTTQLQSQYAAARNPNVGGFVARFALVSPFQGQSGANADDWYTARPGTEALVARALAALVAQKKGYSGPALPWLAGADVARAAEASGIDAAALDQIASQFAAGVAVALPGGVVGASQTAVDLAIATYLLNLVSGNAGITFGLGAAYDAPIDGFARLQSLIAEMAAGNVGVLLVDDVNPLYALPAATGFAEALAKVGTVVALSSHPDETSANASLVLPTSSAFEDWGDESPRAGLHLLRQPAMTPLHDTRSLGDILLATAKAAGFTTTPAAPAEVPGGESDFPVGVPAAPAGVAPAPGAPAVPAAVPAAPSAPSGFDFPNWREYLKAHWQATHYARAGATAPFNRWWEQALADGFVAFDAALTAPELTGAGHTFEGNPAAFAGDGEYYLLAHPHPFRFDGRYANQPWAQEVPDPMTGQVWDAWVELHPDTAKKLGVDDNGLVEITTPSGTLRLAVEIYPEIRPDAIGVAFGQGHRASGRYADEIGKNVVDLLGSAGTTAGTLAWQQVRAVVKATGAHGDLVSTFGSDTDEKRQLAPVVPADAIAKVGDAPAEHAGELTGVHHLPRDARLEKTGNLEFYPIPDHPVYRWGMTVDVNACNGCGICAVACYAENNLPVVGKQKVGEGREMGWIRVNRYRGYAHAEDGPAETRFLPMMCQQCGHAPCESVCPVLATYHTIDGLNAMVYNRCVGTRYCANACPYKVRRFNWHSYVWPEPFNLQLNPDVSARTMGVMEKCTFCVQRIRAVRIAYRDAGFNNVVPSEAIEQLPACAEACPTRALTFGNLVEEASVPKRSRASARSYEYLAELNTFPAINYLAKASFHAAMPHHGGGHDAADGEHAAPSGHTESHPPAGEHGAPSGAGH